MYFIRDEGQNFLLKNVLFKRLVLKAEAKIPSGIGRKENEPSFWAYDNVVWHIGNLTNSHKNIKTLIGSF